MSGVTILDIETIAQDKEQILAKLPPWDEAEARTRVPKNYKLGPAISGWLEMDQADHGKDILERAALLPEYATTAIVGLMRSDSVTEQIVCYDDKLGALKEVQFQDVFFQENEADVLNMALDTMDCILRNSGIITGYCIKSFDLPFLIKRSWLLGVKVPRRIFNPVARYPLSEQIVDLRDVWNAGRREDAAKRIRLDDVLAACGLPPKTGDGKDFGKLWESDRAAALEYSRNDLLVERTLAERLGIIHEPRLTSPSLIASMEELDRIP